MPPKPTPAAAKPAAAKPATTAAASAKKVQYVPVIGAARQQVSVRKSDAVDAVSEQVTIPAVFVAPIRPDIVHFVHYNMAKNHRQAYAVSAGAGHQHSAESWGTGRAVSRIPRVSGGGTSRAGQAAFGNMCRKGRMFAPTKIWRRWHRKINTNQKRYAVASALAASALPALVMARGHRVENVPEIPLVLEAGLESIQRTKQAITALKSVGAYDDVVKAKDSRKLRAGKGKMRNRRHVNRRGPLVVYNEDQGIVRAFRNLPGVEVAQVDSLNLLQLAPGGHLGRFVLWTSAAFSKLHNNWGSFNRVSGTKKDYHLPRPVMTNSDLTRIINSDEIQSKVRDAVTTVVRARRHKNPLTNMGVKIKLNPYSAVLRRAELLKSTQSRQKSAKEATIAKKRAAADKKHTATFQTANFAHLTNDASYAEDAEARKAKAAAAKAAKPVAKVAAPKKK